MLRRFAPSLIILILLPSVCWSENPHPAGFDAAIATLLDPHAPSWNKMEACAFLGDHGSESLDAMMALARQSKYDMEPVREMALHSLQRLVGAQRVAAWRNHPDPPPRDAQVEALDKILTWKDLLGAQTSFFSPNPSVRIAAATKAVRLYQKDQAIPDKITSDDRVKDALLQCLSDLSAQPAPATPRSIMELANALGPDRPPAVPLVLRALADPDARPLAKKTAEALFVPANGQNSVIIAGIAQVLTDHQGSAAAIANALDRLYRMGEGARPLTQRYVLYHRAMGSTQAKSILESWSADETPTAQLAAQIAALDQYPRQRLAMLLYPDDREDPKYRRVRAAALLVDTDPIICQLTAAVIVADPTTYDAYSILTTALSSGPALSAQTITALHLEPKKTYPLVAQALSSDQASGRLFAINLINAMNLQGPELKAPLEKILSDPDDTVRYAAAELLNRKDILARREIPHLLEDLKHDDPARRILAARQLDELGAEPKAITAALIRAVDRRDMPVRQGLILAIAQAHAQRKDSIQILNQLTNDPDPTNKAYARAALREIQPAK